MSAAHDVLRDVVAASYELHRQQLAHVQQVSAELAGHIGRPWKLKAQAVAEAIALRKEINSVADSVSGDDVGVV